MKCHAHSLYLPPAIPDATLSRRVQVNRFFADMDTLKIAGAGDTIATAPGTYAGDQTLIVDPGNLPNSDMGAIAENSYRILPDPPQRKETI
ncbi:MAG: hypothetical protein GF398_02655 [Chitinivibrionales bacterium]|nr:hypothetical protein [Chitinivibrionales bacterium]